MPMDFYLQRVLEAIMDGTAGMTPGQLSARPAGKWSSAEILEHLTLTFRATATGLERVAQSGKPGARRPTLRDRLFTLVVVQFGYLPSGREAPEYTRPRGLPAASVLSTLRQDLQRMDAAIADCERQFGLRVKIANQPILGPLTATEWRKFHWVHTRHHLRQIAARRG